MPPSGLYRIRLNNGRRKTQPNESREGILYATSRKGTQGKQIDPTMHRNANLQCCWRNTEKASFNQ